MAGEERTRRIQEFEVSLDFKEDESKRKFLTEVPIFQRDILLGIYGFSCPYFPVAFLNPRIEKLRGRTLSFPLIGLKTSQFRFHPCIVAW